MSRPQSAATGRVPVRQQVGTQDATAAMDDMDDEEEELTPEQIEAERQAALGRMHTFGGAASNSAQAPKVHWPQMSLHTLLDISCIQDRLERRKSRHTGILLHCWVLRRDLLLRRLACRLQA